MKTTFNPIYMGADVDYKGDALKIVRGPRGQVVNKEMLDHQAQFAQRIIHVSPRVYVSVGRGLGNCAMIEADDGIIIVDTDSSVEAASEILAEFRKITDKPVKAIIYSHYHYTGGTLAFVSPENYGSVEIWAHENHMKNMLSTFGDISTGFFRRLHIFHGSFLPTEGEDGFAGEGLGPFYKNPKFQKETLGYLPPNHLIPDQEKTCAEICGLRFEFYPATSETDDSMIIWMPDEKVSFDNHAWPAFANLYSLRGTSFRDPLGWMRGIDILRTLRPEHLCSMHGVPLNGADNIYQILTDYRDSIQYLYDSVVIGFNNGKSVEEIIAEIEIPRHLCSGVLNRELYGEIDYHIRGIYDGLIGWFGNDAVECHRLTPDCEATKMVDAFGGLNSALSIADKALKDKEYIWAAQVAGYALRAQPDCDQARTIKANALRMIARVTPASGTRAFYMTQALALEGKVDPMAFRAVPSKEVIASLPYDTFIKSLRFQIDRKKIWDVDLKLAFVFTDIKKASCMHIRRGVIEDLGDTADADVKIEMTFDTFASILTGTSISSLVKSGDITVVGDATICVEIMTLLEL